MKLLFVTCLEELKSDVMKLFNQAGVTVFSVSETMGVRDDRPANLLDDWFGNKEGEFRSLFLFSFTNESTAALALDGIRRYNESAKTQFPVRAFVLPVEAASHTE